MARPPWSNLTLDLCIGDADLEIAAATAPGREPIVFLHGFGSTKEDYVDVTHYPGLAGRPFLAYDAPSFGESTTSRPDAVSIPFLVQTALAVLDGVGVDRFHFVGHCMGSLTALLLAELAPDRVLTFTAIQGNAAPDDRALNRQVTAHPAEAPATFLAEYAARCRASAEYSSALYGSRVLATVDPLVVKPVFESMIDLFATGDPVRRFTSLPMPRMLLYGQHTPDLAYLPSFRHAGVVLAEIKHSGRWPMYANPPAMWSALHSFLLSAEAAPG